MILSFTNIHNVIKKKKRLILKITIYRLFLIGIYLYFTFDFFALKYLLINFRESYHNKSDIVIGYAGINEGSERNIVKRVSAINFIKHVTQGKIK